MILKMRYQSRKKLDDLWGKSRKKDGKIAA
jgi:hypothetical protein